MIQQSVKEELKHLEADKENVSESITTSETSIE